MTDVIITQIDDVFSEYIEKPDVLTKYVISLAEENNFNEKKFKTDLRKYLSKMGASGEDLNEMISKGDEVFSDHIIPNKSILYPHLEASKKLKLPVKGKQTMTTLKVKPPIKEEKAEEVSKKVSKKTIKANDSESNDEAEAKSDEASDAISGDEDTVKKDTKKGKGRKSKKDPKKPTRTRAYDLYFKDVQDTVKTELAADWDKQYKGVPYQSNPTVVSKEIGRRWREVLTSDERDAYEVEAVRQNAEKGILPTHKKKDESSMKPLTHYQYFNKEKYESMEAKYRKDNKVPKDEKVKPTEIMRMTAALWNETIKPNEKLIAEYQAKTDIYNKENGRVAKPKVEKEKSSDKKTNAYRMFCADWRQIYREANPDSNRYEEARLMNEEWNTTIKTDEEKLKRWQDQADEENISRGYEIEAK